MNIGTTSGCIFDNTQKVASVLNKFEFYRNQKNHWIHIDGAWCGPYIRFLQMATQDPK